MTDTAALMQAIDKSGFKRSYIAKQLGLSAYGLSMKIKNKHEFKASEIGAICDILHISSSEDRMRIFFAK